MRKLGGSIEEGKRRSALPTGIKRESTRNLHKQRKRKNGELRDLHGKGGKTS